MSPLRLRLPELRDVRGWSQAELARQSGVAQTTISAIERGQSQGVNFDVLERLAEALGTSASYLITDEPRQPVKH